LALIALSGLSLISGLHAAVVWAPRLVDTVHVGGAPIGVAVNPDTNMVYVTSTISRVTDNGSTAMDGLTVINGSTNRIVATLPIGTFTGPIAVDPSTDRLFEIGGDPGSIYVIDASTSELVATIADGGGPDGIAVNPATDMIYVTNGASNSVSVINGSTNGVVKSITVGNNPSGVAVDPATDTVYVAGSPDEISVVNGSTNTVIATVNLTSDAWGLSVNPSTDLLYVASYFSRSVTVIDGATNSVVASIPVNGSNDFSGSIAVNANTNTVYVAGRDSEIVSVIAGASNSLSGFVTVGDYPEGLAVNPFTGLVYVANRMSGTVSVISSGPGPSSTDVTCESSLFLMGASTACTAVVAGASPTGVVTWSHSGPGVVSFSSDSCTLSLGRCRVTATGTGAGSVTVIASYGGDSINPPSSGNFTLFVSNPSRATADIVQHKYVLASQGVPQLNVTLSSPVTKGDVLVVGAVFGSNLSGSITDSLKNSWAGDVDPGNSYPTDYTYPNDARLGTGMWWAKVGADGNDTISIASNNSTMLVDVFEIRGANLSTAMYMGGGASPQTSTLVDYYSCAPSCFKGSGSFVFFLTGIDSAVSGTCFAENGTTEVDGSLVTQSPGFTIEPYCGSISPLTNEQVIGEYDVTDAPGYTVALGVNPAYDGWRSVQIFAVDPAVNSSVGTTTTTVARSLTSTATQYTSSLPTWAYATVAMLLIIGLTVGYTVRRKSISSP
jgi:YVTN family beta-propeller protein